MLSLRRWRPFLAGAVVGGVVVGITTYAFTHLTRSHSTENVTTENTNTNDDNDDDNKADDECLSLYYHNHVPEDGSGIPVNVDSCTEEEVEKLKTVQNDYRRLSIEFYQNAVSMLPIV